ncbi:lytic murein transglycosylase [uncultured Nocardioides sp.]|uniref:lytic murein transglycosylase n=1 Tax=uncultured Nocardioides sp. TaxID=198441 RepID=UPI0026345253|nr:lytic murein transglycosylase [uncultured Nocardioides sp.]
MTLRHLLYVAAGLALLSTVAWFGQQRLPSSDPVLISVGPPSLAAEPQPGPAPSPVVAAAPGTPQVDAGWLRRTAASAGIPEVAVAAYADAVLVAPKSCGLGWTTLAGIGWVESQHGTLGGRTLDAAGRPSSPILGPALDGTGPVAAIRATADSTRLHGDPEWDHAVGPLQFIPSTWETWARDGDGDGIADPQDLDDAAAAAAAYLCATGQDLTTGPGWSAAIFAYNHSSDYVNSVYTAASAYASRAAG